MQSKSDTKRTTTGSSAPGCGNGSYDYKSRGGQERIRNNYVFTFEFDANHDQVNLENVTSK